MRNWRFMFALGLVGTVVMAGRSTGGEPPAAARRPTWEACGPTIEASPKAVQHVVMVPDPRKVSNTVWSMIEGFRCRSPEAYVAMMTDDYRFDSDDPAFAAAFPNGMTKSDEAAFATHLFLGGARAPDGSPLPTAGQVLLPSCAVLTGSVSPGRDTAHVVLDHYVVRVALTSGDTLAVGVSRSQLDLVPTPNGWRICRWHEWLRTPSAEEAMRQRLASAEAPSPRETPAANMVPARAPARGAMALAAGFDIPTRLELAGEPDAGHSALVFDLAMPRSGGALEIFDVMGRRVGLRDLADLAAGRHRIAMDAASLGSGIYFARVRQEQGVATARIVWTR